VWLRPARTYRTAPPLTRDRIVAGAVALLDSEGAAKLTMRRLAEHLGAGPTTLYWHVRTKDDVLDLALDEIFAEVPLPDAADWRERLSALATGWRAVMLRHPWSAALLVRPMLGPHVLTRTEFLQATLVAAGLNGAELTAATYAIAHHVVGAALAETASRQLADAAAEHAAAQYLRDNAEAYPTLAASGHLEEPDWDDAFARGLDYLLDGIAVSLAT
jgi:AcrR family transcriptional regulator